MLNASVWGLVTGPKCLSVVPAKCSASGIHVTSFQSTMECDVCIHKNLYMFNFLRMTKVLMASAPPALKIWWLLLQTVIFALWAPERFCCAKVLSQCETCELLDGEITTVGAITLKYRPAQRFRHADVCSSQASTSSRSRATCHTTCTSAGFLRQCRVDKRHNFVPGGRCAHDAQKCGSRRRSTSSETVTCSLLRGDPFASVKKQRMAKRRAQGNHRSHTVRSGQEPHFQEGPCVRCGLAVSPRKLWVPHCEERAWAAPSRRDQDCAASWF